MPITHSKVSIIADGSDTSQVRPGDWNAPHILRFSRRSVSANFSINANDEVILATAGAGGITGTLPDATSTAGMWVKVKRIDSGAGNLNIVPAGSDTIDGFSSYLLTNQYQFIDLVADSGIWYIVGGN
jgi:hypothetical protein